MGKLEAALQIILAIVHECFEICLHKEDFGSEIVCVYIVWRRMYEEEGSEFDLS